MKLTDKQKKQLRKEVEKETCPRVLVFEKEIEKKKNQDKTIEEIMKMVKDSKTAAANFIVDNEERFNFANFSSIKDKEITKGHLFDHIEFLSMPENEDEFKVLLQKVLDNYSNYN